VERDVWHWTKEYRHEVPPVMQRADVVIEALTTESGIASTDAGLKAAADAIAALAGGGSEARDSVAHRVMNATAMLVGGDRPAILHASELASTSAFSELVDRMARDPEACVDAYNRAARNHPASGLRELSADVVNDRWELPLWRLLTTGPRERVYAEELGAGEPGSAQRLAPRAILLTGFLRRYACDLFIHGMGGGVYDRACDDWFAAWVPGERLAPTAVVSATLRMKFEGVDSLSAAESTAARARATWKLQHAVHNPGAVGDHTLQDAKRADIAGISAFARGGIERRRAYLAMHDRLAAYRHRHAPELAVLAAELSRIDRAVTTGVQQQARDWPFMLHPPARLTELRASIDCAFSV
jgi:hypothetical protein